MRKDEVKNFWLPLITATMFLIVLALNAPCCFGAELGGERDVSGLTYNMYRDDPDINPEQDLCRMLGLNQTLTKFIEPDDMTDELVDNRVDTYTLVEVLLCIRIGDGIDGRVLNTATEYNYTSFTGCDDVFPGDIVVRYLVFDNTTGEDTFDVYDFIVDDWYLIEEY